MLSSTSLEVAIGMTLVYLLLSVLCTAINETLAGLLSSRGQLLEKGIKNLFTEGKMEVQDANGNPLLKPLADLIYEHGLVQSLYRSGSGQPIAATRKARNLPSYIPSRTFAVALFDTLFRHAADVPPTLASMLQDINSLPDSKAKQALIALVRVGQGDAERTKAAFAAWFDDAMDRVSGLYKRKTQVMVFLIGLSLTLLLNINSVTLSRTLWNSPAARSYATTVAEKYGHSGADVPSSGVAQAQLSDLEAMGLPLGWNPPRWPWVSAPTLVTHADRSVTTEPGTFSLWLLLVAIFGWLVTAMATTLGAPFWFDLLNQFMVVRSTIKPREKSDVESSKDPK